ncbi:MAG: hypothetical protein QXG97_00080 [Nitrososphaerota archaeon]
MSLGPRVYQDIYASDPKIRRAVYIRVKLCRESTTRVAMRYRISRKHVREILAEPHPEIDERIRKLGFDPDVQMNSELRHSDEALREAYIKMKYEGMSEYTAQAIFAIPHRTLRNMVLHRRAVDSIVREVDEEMERRGIPIHPKWEPAIRAAEERRERKRREWKEMLRKRREAKKS